MKADAASLRDWVDGQPAYLGPRWLEKKELRKKEEARFHDSFRHDHQNETPTAFPNQRFYQATDVVDTHIDRWVRLNATRGARTFLDFACGHGAQSIRAAQAGSALAVGIDISEVSVRNARENAAKAGFAGSTRFLQRDCEDTGLPSAVFSAGICMSMLHHLDLNFAYPELARLMAPGGRVLCIEALAYNPLIQAYRRRTPELRTDWEKGHILGLNEVRVAEKWFRVENVKYFLMAAPLGAFLPSGAPRRMGIKVGEIIDSVATRIPFLQRWSWQFAFELFKPS